MKSFAVIALIGGIGAATAALAGPTTATLGEVAKDPIYAAAHWDDDHDDRYHSRRQVSPMPVPDAAAIRKAGIVRVKEVERDDGKIEVEGYDAQGREIKLVMDAGGKRVLATRVDHRWDD